MALTNVLGHVYRKTVSKASPEKFEVTFINNKGSAQGSKTGIPLNVLFLYLQRW